MGARAFRDRNGSIESELVADGDEDLEILPIPPKLDAATAKHVLPRNPDLNSRYAGTAIMSNAEISPYHNFPWNPSAGRLSQLGQS
jgi:hypothetical protein